MRPILMPARARARRAAWPPGPSVLLPEPACTRGINFQNRERRVLQLVRRKKRNTCATKLHVKGIDAVLLAPGGGILGCQHGRVGRRFVAVGLDFHPTSDSSNGLAPPTTLGQFSSDTCANIPGRLGDFLVARISTPGMIART